MKLVVKDRVPPRYTNTFVLQIEFMSGDADAYETKEVPVSHDEAVRCLTFLNALLDFPDSGGWDSPRHLGAKSGWRELPEADVVNDFYPWNVQPPAGYHSFIEWGRDSTCQGERASVDAVDVVWYDIGGNECAVEVVP